MKTTDKIVRIEVRPIQIDDEGFVTPCEEGQEPTHWGVYKLALDAFDNQIYAMHVVDSLDREGAIDYARHGAELYGVPVEVK